MTGRPGHWSEPGEYNILFLGSILVISSQVSSALGYREFTLGRKKEPKPKLFGPDIFQWGRGLPREGVGAKKFDTSLETREIKLFGRDIPGFCRDIPPKCPKSLRKKSLCSISVSYHTRGSQDNKPIRSQSRNRRTTMAKRKKMLSSPHSVQWLLRPVIRGAELALFQKESFWEKESIHRPAPVQSFSLPKKNGATEERFRWWIWFSWFS